MSIQQIEPAILFDSNIYLVSGTDKTALIDTGTGFDIGSTIANIKKKLDGRSLDYVIITHRHYDHVGGLGAIIKEFSPKVYAGHLDAQPLRDGDSESTLGTKFGGKISPMDVIDFDEGDIIDLGDHRLRAIDTPGHTIGSICIIDDITGALFSGDTVFFDGVGNTIHPTGSQEMLIASLKKLVNLDINGFYPGHGPAVNKGGNEFVVRGLKVLGVNYEDS